jgi:hypothetical protein
MYQHQLRAYKVVLVASAAVTISDPGRPVMANLPHRYHETRNLVLALGRNDTPVLIILHIDLMAHARSFAYQSLILQRAVS